jgi:(5-formylfuran-3-yl)methyl phosphate synthase
MSFQSLVESRIIPEPNNPRQLAGRGRALPEGPLLLVSVRTRQEALAAIEGGADIIDIKEPANGPLGAASTSVRREIAEACARGEPRPRISAAAGELLEHGSPRAWDAVEGIAFHKLGLSGCRGLDWRAGLESWAASLRDRPRPSSLVPVAYGDHPQAASPPPLEVLGGAADLGIELILVDTHDKSRGTLRDCMRDGEIARLIEEGRRRGVRVALAGSLSLIDITELAPLGALALGVRGSACAGSRRDGEVSRERVRELAAACRKPVNCR